MINYNTNAQIAITLSENGGFVITAMVKNEVKSENDVKSRVFVQGGYTPKIYTANNLDDAILIVREQLALIQV